MNFRERLRVPKTMIPIAMMFLVMGIFWPYFFHPASQLAQSLNQGVRGLLFGISFGISLVAIRLALLARQRRRSVS
jgi:hypothetical protein